jgi:hypothetical protein
MSSATTRSVAVTKTPSLLSRRLHGPARSRRASSPHPAAVWHPTMEATRGPRRLPEGRPKSSTGYVNPLRVSLRRRKPHLATPRRPASRGPRRVGYARQQPGSSHHLLCPRPGPPGHRSARFGVRFRSTLSAAPRLERRATPSIHPTGASATIAPIHRTACGPCGPSQSRKIETTPGPRCLPEGPPTSKRLLRVPNRRFHDRRASP